MYLLRQFHGDILKTRPAPVGKDTDMGPVNGMGDPATECLHIIHVEDDDLILADQLDMMGSPLRKIEFRERLGLHFIKIQNLITFIVQEVLCGVQALVIAASVMYVIVLLYVFPLLASVHNTNAAMLKNAFLIGTHYLFATILVFAVHFAMFFAVVAVFTPLIIFGEGLCAMISAWILNSLLIAVSGTPEDYMEDEPEEYPEEAAKNISDNSSEENT